MRLLLRLLLALVLVHTLVHATTITGQIYDGDSMQLLNGTLIMIEDNAGNVIVQKMFNEKYELIVPDGNYTLRAYYYSNGSLEQYTDHNFQTCEENMEFDLILIPYELQALVPGFQPPPTPNQQQTEEDNAIYSIILSIALLAMGAAIIYFYLTKKKKDISKETTKETGTNERADDMELDDDCKQVLRILKENEGRIIQREVREIVNFSESKMSLIISELELAGHIKKIRKGRENILKLIKDKD